MAYLAGFRNDIFVSHAHEELFKQLAVDGKTWTRQVVEILKALVERELSVSEGERRVMEFFDEKSMEMDKGLTPQLKEQVEGSAVFLAFVSKSYFESEWCREEAALFRKGSPARFSAEPEKTGIFLLEIEETDRPNWPDAFKDEAGKPFIAKQAFKPGKSGLCPLAFPDISEGGKETQLLVDTLASIASQIGKTLRGLAPSVPPPPPRSETCVFVGYSPKANKEPRRNLLEDLAHRGLSVLPSRPLNDYKSDLDFGDGVRKDLARSDLAVVLLADSNGYFKMTTTQIELVREAGLDLVLWSSAGLDQKNLDPDELGNPEYAKLLPALLEEAPTCSMDDLAANIEQRLSASEMPPDSDTVPPFEDLPTILVFSGNLAGYRFVRSELKPALENVIQDKKWRVMYPRLDRDSPLQLMTFYEENIPACDAVIVVHCQEETDAVFKTVNAMGAGHGGGGHRLRGLQEQGRESVLGTIRRLGRGFKESKPNGDFYVAVIDGPPPGLGVDFGGNPPVFDCSKRLVGPELEKWLEDLHEQVVGSSPPTSAAPGLAMKSASHKEVTSASPPADAEASGP